MRITEIEIAGTLYPLCFSVKAYKEIEKKYGGLSEINEALTDVSEILWTLELLSNQGAAYLKLTENVESKTITSENAEILIGFKDIPKIKTAIYDCLLSGMKRDVEVEVDPKNAEGAED